MNALLDDPVKLPAAQGPHAPEQHAATRPHLVVIDDHPIVLQALVLCYRQGLRDLVSSVSGAGGMDDAMARIRDDARPCAVSLDLCLQGLQGLPAIADLRQLPQVGPIVVVSGAPAEVWAPAVLAAGADAFVSKSDHLTELVRVVRRALQARTGDQAASPARSPGHRHQRQETPWTRACRTC